MKKIIFILVLIITLSIQSAYAETSRATINELKTLPEFCIYKLPKYRTAEGNKKWKKIFGDLWVHMHHYCWGVNYRNRASYSSGRSKKDNLNSAVDNINYVLSRTPKNHFYRPQILLDMAKAKKMQKKYDEAISLNEEAIFLKKDFVPAYLSLSRLYRRLGDKKEAKEVIELGLKYKPNSKILKKKLKRLSK